MNAFANGVPSGTYRFHLDCSRWNFWMVLPGTWAIIQRCVKRGALLAIHFLHMECVDDIQYPAKTHVGQPTPIACASAAVSGFMSAIRPAAPLPVRFALDLGEVLDAPDGESEGFCVGRADCAVKIAPMISSRVSIWTLYLVQTYWNRAHS